MDITEWHWEITHRCNLHCGHCLLGDVAVAEMTNEQIHRAIDVIALCGGTVIKMTGGEPTCCDGFPTVLRHIRQNGIGVDIITNGVRLEADVLAELSLIGAGVTVSIDGDEGLHNDVRGYGAFEMTMTTLRRLKHEGLTVCVSSTLHQKNLGALDAILALCAEEGVDAIHLNDINLQGRAGQNPDRFQISMSVDELETYIVETVSLHMGLAPDQWRVDLGCDIDPTRVYMTAAGDIHPCVEPALCPEIGWRPIAHVHQSAELTEQITRAFSECVRPQHCRYRLLVAPGVSVVLNRGGKCLSRKG